jgi:hypothetical protein
MTDGLDVLLAWVGWAALVGLLAWVVLRRTNDDPFDELRRSQSQPGEPADRAAGERPTSGGT